VTPFVLATATSDRPLPWGWLLLAALVLGVVYIAECAWWPFGHCRRCNGQGKHSRKDGKVWRRCRRCKGSGTRLRVGRRVWNHFARIRDDAS